MKRQRKILALTFVLVAVGWLFVAERAEAALLCAAGETSLSVTAVSPSDPNQPQDASACIGLNTAGPGGTITIRLQNDAALITNIPSVLDGFSFTLTGSAPASISLTSVVATSFLDCQTGQTCNSVSTFMQWNGPHGTALSSPYNWGVITGASGAPINFTFSLLDPALLAGGGSLHPAGIINNNFATGGSNHLGDPAHNDYLLGPVTFNLAYTGNDPTGVNEASFYFGTLGEKHSTSTPPPPGGSAPEPGTLALLGLGFAGLGAMRRRRQ